MQGRNQAQGQDRQPQRNIRQPEQPRKARRIRGHDQEKRARAASDRGLSETVMADELMRLESEVGSFLDRGKADELRKKLAGSSFPAVGNEDAAAIIDPEVCK